MTFDYIAIKETFLKNAKTDSRRAEDFEKLIIEVATLLNTAPNADNFQFAFDALYFLWECKLNIQHGEEIPIPERDRIALKYSRFGEHQEAVIQKQIDEANQWAKDLEGAGIDDPMQTISFSKAEAEFILAKEQRETAVATHPSPIAIPQRIVQLYRKFYRAEKYNPDATNVLKPLLLTKEVISKSSSKGEELAQEILGRISAHMKQVRARSAKGRWVIRDLAEERQAIIEFASFMVFHVLQEKFRNDKSSFSSKRRIGLIEDACDALYRLEQDKENND